MPDSHWHFLKMFHREAPRSKFRGSKGSTREVHEALSLTLRGAPYPSDKHHRKIEIPGADVHDQKGSRA